MKKQFTITIEVTGSTKENQTAFDILVAESFETLKKQVAALDNVVTLTAAIVEAPAPVIEVPKAV